MGDGNRAQRHCHDPFAGLRRGAQQSFSRDLGDAEHVFLRAEGNSHHRVLHPHLFPSRRAAQDHRAKRQIHAGAGRRQISGNRGRQW